MKVLILGGDGYLGWSTAMYLAAHGHQVSVIDNYARRQLCQENNIQFLFPVPTMQERSQIWEALSGKKITCHVGNLQDWDFCTKVVKQSQPEAIIHYAEQPSAPYSMLNRHTAAYTLQNNVMVTFNLIHAVKEFAPTAHIVKLGTMGEYGTPNIEIEEGWLDIQHKGRRDRFLFPRQAGSLYHTTKIMDTDLLWFYVRMWKLRVTDLMQGPVYGIHTPQTQLDERLLPLFNYDEIFGTVLNRFIVQAASGIPLTVYGKGEQRRGFLNVLDTLACIHLAVLNPPEAGKLAIYNQFTEVFSVNELAEKVCQVATQLGLVTPIQTLPNPRIEAEEHFYQPAHTALFNLGLKPHLLTDEVLAQMLETALHYKDRIQPEQILRGITWRPETPASLAKVS